MAVKTPHSSPRMIRKEDAVMTKKTSKYWFVAVWTIGLAMVLLVVIPGCQKGSDKPSPYVNTQCPIMGSAIDPADVPADHVREYKGQKVAFCCDQCVVAWDKLSDSEKDAKLAKAE